MNLDEILAGNGIGREIRNIVITCVDPGYPVSSLGRDFAGVDVRYSPNDHELRGHVQLAGEGYTQAFLAYNGAGFDQIKQSEVHANLPNGIVQLAYRDGTLVIGIPGDIYAFDTEGRGFGFGAPDKAPGAAAVSLLTDILGYASTPREQISVAAMRHPDCGLIANNLGITNETMIEYASHLAEDGSDFPESDYAYAEKGFKDWSFSGFEGLMHDMGVQNVVAITPAYVQRTPGAYKALHGSH